MLDLGLDGVDIDYEPSVQCNSNGSGGVTCNTDAQLQQVGQRLVGQRLVGRAVGQWVGPGGAAGGTLHAGSL